MKAKQRWDMKQGETRARNVIDGSFEDLQVSWNTFFSDEIQCNIFLEFNLISHMKDKSSKIEAFSYRHLFKL